MGKNIKSSKPKLEVIEGGFTARLQRVKKSAVERCANSGLTVTDLVKGTLEDFERISSVLKEKRIALGDRR